MREADDGRASRPTIVPANGVGLCVQTFGESEAPAILLIAGAASSMDWWRTSSAPDGCHLVEPFLRGTKRIRTDHAGVGLGLAIVKSITQAHDGTLTLTPRAAGALRHGATTRRATAHGSMTIRGIAAHPERNSQRLWISVSCGVSVAAC